MKLPIEGQKVVVTTTAGREITCTFTDGDFWVVTPRRGKLVKVINVESWRSD